jgi:DHA1 family quinolone resistance protein-like MFS transporter
MKPHLIQILSYAATNASWTFIPIFAKELGFSDTSIGIAVALYALTIFLSSYLFGRASDKRGIKVYFLKMGLLASSISFFLQIFIQNELSLLFIRSIVGFCAGIFPPILLAYGHDSKKDLGKFTSFGSLGWFLGGAIGGFIGIYLSLNGVFIFSSLAFFISFLITYRLDSIRTDPLHIPLFPKKIIKKNLGVYLPFFLRQLGGALIWTFWPIYIQSLGADLFWVGMISAINSLFQFIIMYTITDKLNSHFMLRTGLILSSITFFLYSMASNFWEILPVQILLSFSWSFLYVGSIKYVTKRNIEKATVVGLIDSTKSLSTVVAPFLSILLVALGDYRTTMVVGSAFAFIGFISFNVIEYMISSKH